MNLLAMALFACGTAQADVTSLPAPATDTEIAAPGKKETLVLAGGCFWGVQAVFQHIKGIDEVVSGYTGGTVDKPTYNQVSAGTTAHAEAVKITYDPSKVTLGTLLRVFFSVAHNPTELNKQGPDVGTQYRSAVFASSPEQEKVTKAYIEQLDKAKVFSAPIVTEVAALGTFYPAEDYHQNYATLHPDQPYIKHHDLPKLENLKKHYPDLYQEL